MFFIAIQKMKGWVGEMMDATVYQQRHVNLLRYCVTTLAQP